MPVLQSVIIVNILANKIYYAEIAFIIIGECAVSIVPHTIINDASTMTTMKRLQKLGVIGLVVRHD